MGKVWDSFKKTGKSKYWHEPDKETEKGFGAKDYGTPIKALPRFAIDMRVYQEWTYNWAKELFRIMKSGAHILVFGGNRTYHRMACAIEDAGFEVRDMVEWVYGSGFPKGQNISKTIDKKLGFYDNAPKVPPEEYPERMKRAMTPKMDITSGGFHAAVDESDREKRKQAFIHSEKLPVSSEAKRWSGWNTQLKPAHEPILLARKPLSEKTIVDNVLKYGTGGLNIDACRIKVNPDIDTIDRATKRDKRQEGAWEKYSGFLNPVNPMAGVLPSGRYPANFILSHHPDCNLIKEGETKVTTKPREVLPNKGEYGIYGKGDRSPTEYSYDSSENEVWNCVEECPIRILNEQSNGLSPSGAKQFMDIVDYKSRTDGLFIDKSGDNYRWRQRYGDSGGASRYFKTFDGEYRPSRFFYCAKASRSERDAGLGSFINCEVFKVLRVEECQEESPILEGNITLGEGLAHLRVVMEQSLPAVIGGYGTRKKNDIEWNMILFGKNIMEKYQKELKSIISTSIQSTMISQILNYLTVLLTKEYMVDVKLLMENGTNHVENVENLSQYLLITINEKMESALGASNVVLGMQLIIKLKEEKHRSSHITVKTRKLMQYLCRLITPSNGIIIDPFIGSGTTAIAALLEGFRWLGCDNNPEYVDIANKRIAYWSSPEGLKMAEEKHKKKSKRRKRKKSSKSKFKQLKLD